MAPRSTPTTAGPARAKRGTSGAGFSLIEILFTLGIIATIGAIVVPIMSTIVAGFRLSGDARSIANSIAVAKIEAASKFTRARLYADLGAGTHRIERWDKTTSQWVAVSGDTPLASNTRFDFGSISTPPPNTQATIAQAQQCNDASGNPVSDTACVIFNSRGLPIDNAAAITAIDAIYVTDGTAVYGITVAPTGMMRTWRTGPTTASWTLQ